MNNPGPHRLVWLASLALCCLAPAATRAAEEPAAEQVSVSESPEGSPEADAAGAPAPEFDDLPWEVRPYRVLVSMAVADTEVTDRRFVDRTLDALQRQIQGTVGPYWQPVFQRNDWLFPQTAASVAALQSEQLTERFESSAVDKVLLVVLSTEGPAYQLSSCEWDRSTQMRGPMHTRRVVDRRRIASVTFELLRTVFRPTAQIDLAEGTFAELRIRGGELLGPDSAMFPFQPGDLLQGYFRYLDRDRNVRKIQDVPWTYLQIDQVDRSRMTATIQTPFNNPFAGSRRRVDLVAIRVEPAYPETRVALSPRTNPNQPLVGVRVRIYSKLPSEENPQPEHIDLMTDRDGIVRVPASPENPLRRLIVHSGGAVLSNVPFIPGLEPSLDMQLPDDSPRLQVEGSLAMVQGDLIDVISRRVVMLARAVSQARKEQFDEADQLLAEVDAQPSIASFESRILAIRVPAVEQARANRDRSQEKRIRMMCKDLEDLVHKYLDRQRVEDAKAEVRELKQIAGK